MRKRKKANNEFEHWLSLMDGALEEFFAMLPPEVRDRLDDSIDSLDVLEAWLLQRYPRFEDIKREGEAIPLDGAARYIGETFRKIIGGRWWADPTGKIMGGWPSIVDCRTSGSGIYPLSEATAATDRRRGNYISSGLRYQLAFLSGQERPAYIIPPEKRRKNKKTPDEKWLDYWVSLMDRALGELFDELPDHVRQELDFSPASLDVLEAWLLARYPDSDAARAETEVLLLDGVARYVGETFRKNVGGRWWFDLDDWTHGLPQLADIAEGMPSLCPLALVREATELRSRDLLGKVLQRYGASPPAHADRAGSAGKN